MKWNKYRLATTTEAVDLISYTLAEMGIEGIEIEDKGGEPDITLLQIEDEDVLEALADAFDEMLDEEEFGEEDEDDAKWDEFINKKLD